MAAIVEKISERTRQMCRDNLNSMDCSPMPDLNSEKTNPENSIKNLAQSVKNAAVLPTILTASTSNNNNLSKSYHITTLDPLNLEESLNYQPAEHHTLENLVDLAHQEMLQQHQEDTTMIGLYEDDEHLSVGSVGSIACKSNFAGGIGSNNNINLSRGPHNGYNNSTNDHHILLNHIKSFILFIKFNDI